MSTRVTVYCDESGNDGPNYLNKESPFYILAGWIVPEESIVDATVAIEEVRQSDFNQGVPELKYRLFDRNDHRRKLLVRLIDRFGQLNLTPVYVIAEKRFCIAGKIVETFLDPSYNPLATNGMTWSVDFKQELANTLYDRLPQEVLERFANAYRNPTPSDLAGALVEVENACRNCVNPELAAFFHGSHESIDQIAAAEIHATDTWGKAGGTINFPCLITFIMMVEQIGRTGLFAADKIVHDEVSAYQESYRNAFLHHKNLDDYWFTLPGSNLGHGSVVTVDDFETQRSIDQPLIQAADLLAGSINSLAMKLTKGEGLTPHELEIGRFSLTPMLFREHKIAFPICSDVMLNQIGLAIAKCFPEFADGTDLQPYKKADSRGLPLMPPLQAAPKRNTGGPLKAPELPLFGVVSGDERRLITVQYSERSDHPGAANIVVPLFTKRELADAFLAENEQHWEEKHEIRSFDVPNLPNLLSQLKEMAEEVDAIEFDRRGLVKVHEYVHGLEGAMARVLSAFKTGANNVLIEKHIVNDVEIMSLLMSSGQYGAMRLAGGKVVYGATRQEAVDAVSKSIGDGTYD